MKINAPRQNWILLSTTILIAIIFSIYFLVYVKGREKQLNENNFRVLHQIVQNIQSLREGYEKNAQTLAAELRRDSDAEIRPKELRRGIFPILIMGLMSTKDSDCSEIIKKFYDNQSAVSRVLVPVCKDDDPVLNDPFFLQQGIGSSYGSRGLYFHMQKDSFFIKTEYHQFFGNTLVQREDIFDHIIVTKCGEKSDNALLYTNGRFGALPKTFYDTIQTASRFETELNNSAYIVFNQKINEEQNVYLSCLVLKSNFDQQKRSVSPFTIAFLSVALTLIILAMPLLKLQIMNVQEQLHIRDIVFSIASVLIGPAVFIVFVYTFIVFWRGNNIPEAVRHNLKELSYSLENNFNEEIEVIAKQMKDLRVNYLNGEPARITDLKKLVNAERMKELAAGELAYNPKIEPLEDYYMGSDALNSSKSWDFEHFNYIFWADNKARSRVQLSTFIRPSYGQNLSHRKYLTNILENKPTTFTGKDSTYQIAIESIKSVNDGTYEVGIGMPTDCNGCMLPVIATSAKLSSVMDVVLEEGYGFCILDKDGNTLFHSNKMKNLNENFIEETQGAFDNVIGSGTDEFETVNYNGKKQAVYFRPIQSMPDYYIATFINTQVFYNGFTLAVISAFALFVCYILLIFMLFALIFALTYRPVKLKQMIYGLSFTKPFETLKHQFYYKKLIAVMGAVIMYLFFTILIHGKNTDFILGEMVVVSGAILIITFISLSRILPPQEIIHNIFKKNPGSTIYPVILGILGFAVFRAGYLLYTQDMFLYGINALIGAGIITWAAFKCIFIKSPDNTENKILLSPEEAANLQRTFRLFLFLSVIVFSIIPINLFLGICLTKEDEIRAKFRSMELIKHSENWMQAFEKDFSGNFTETSREKFLQSMKKEKKHINLVSDSLVQSTDISTNTDGTLYCKPGKRKATDAYDNGRIPIEEVFVDLYKRIRPEFNERASKTRHYIANEGVNPKWTFHKINAQYNFEIMEESGRNAVFSRVAFPVSNFFSSNLPSVIMTMMISFIILFSFLRFILNKVYGFQFKSLASKTKEFRSDRFADIFLNKENFSIDNSYNNIFLVGVSVAHKNFIKSYFQSQKERHLFMFDLDNFYMIDWEKTSDILNSYRKEIVIRHFPETEKHETLDWDAFIKIREKLNPPIYILFDHFEFGYNDLKANKLKLHLLKDLVDSNRYTVIIKSEINATKLLNFYSESISNIDQILEDKNVANRMDLIAKRDDLAVDYKKWQVILGSFVKVIVPIDHISDDDELKYGDFMSLLAKYMQKAEINTLNEEDRIVAIQQLSYPHYFSIWNSLSKAEKYLVFDMAKDRFVNTVNINGIISLLGKGIFVYDHSLRLMNESFANFVLTAVSSEEALAMEMEAKKKGSWNTAFPVVILVVVSLLIFLSIGQQGFLNDINAYLTSIAALVGLLIRFSGLLAFGNKAAPA